MKIRTVMAALVMAGSTLVALPAQSNAVVISVADTFEQQVISSTNQQRVLYKRVKLSPHACVDKFAESHARWMAINRTLRHQSMSAIMSFCGLRSVGENIAWGYKTGPLTVAAWMHSSGHRANILNSGYRVIGVGAYQDKYGRWWVSQVFGTFR